MICQIVENLAFVETVVTAREHIQTKGKQFFRYQWRNAEPTRAIFRIGNRQADFVFGDDSVEVIGHNAAARRGENIANKKDIHCGTAE